MKFFLSTLCILGLVSLGLGAQSSPDFSGTWAMDLSRSEAAAQGPPLGPVTLTIRQTPNEVRIETTRSGTTQTVKYVPESMRAAAAGELAGTFRWDGSKLVTSLITDINKQAVTVEEVRSLNPAGTEMTVNITLVVQHGYQGTNSNAVQSRTSPNTATGTNVFLKAR